MKKIVFFTILLLSTIASAQSKFYSILADSAKTLTQKKVIYDPTYYSIGYPNGDVPEGKGVCTDVVIRAYRKLEIDLQKLVHEDMKENFDEYPKNWGLKKPDKNIDHRRVPNLMVFFERFGVELTKSTSADDYKPGDIVCWDLGKGITHIGIVMKQKSRNKKQNLILHNIGQGQVIEDFLFEAKIIGHYRFKQ